MLKRAIFSLITGILFTIQSPHLYSEDEAQPSFNRGSQKQKQGRGPRASRTGEGDSMRGGKFGRGGMAQGGEGRGGMAQSEEGRPGQGGMRKGGERGKPGGVDPAMKLAHMLSKLQLTPEQQNTLRGLISEA
ncbi:MAG: hypothetical protein HQL32_11525, partial [Planctomycetes bacterium]|nr:hypothetical protein [Planctomycetota bacterium]